MDAAQGAPRAIDPATRRRALIAGAVGNFMEWFDYAVYAFLASVIGDLFFPSDVPFVSTLATFAVFAVGFFMRPLGGFAMLYVEPVKRDGWRPVAKRVFDLVLSGIALMLTLPMLLLAAVAIKLTSPGPVLYCQERVGYRGRRFRILKFRSMYVNSDSLLQQIADQVPAGPVVKIRRDPRVTPVGRVLRRLSIDELPQLINVVRGDMSLVGPRPEQPSEVALWTPQLFDRLRVRPGVTGVWQVNGRSAARNTKDRWDLYYVDNWSVWRDLTILARTVPAVISSKGAY
jgi:exopolysaccharide biosynthesis polyprenyl glycosylphosphotransferase